MLTFINNYKTTTTASITDVDTSVSVADIVPPLEGKELLITLYDKLGAAESNWEVMKVTFSGVAGGGNLTVERGLEGTTARAWPAGTRVEARVTAGMLANLAQLTSGKVDTSLVPDYIVPSVNTQLNAKVKRTVSSVNATHTLRSDNWIQNFDGTIAGALTIELPGLYNVSLSGSMEVIITQNGVADGDYPDYLFWVSGNWRSTDHRWHNTEARVNAAGDDVLNVRFGRDDANSKVFISIGDVSTTWSYPRIVIRDVITNAVVSGFTPDFSLDIRDTLPPTVDYTMAVNGVGTIADFEAALV